jgi:hypothetical protein
MNYGFDQGKFYIDFKSCSRPARNMREETDIRVRELAQISEKYMLSFSGGIDSQSILHSFCSQGIDIETVFLYMPGYNDVEYEQVQICDKKYNVKTRIIDIDVDSYKEEFLDLRTKLNLLQKVNILHRAFLKMIPSDVNFIQMCSDPFVYISPTNKFYYYVGYHMPEIARHRALSDIERTGKIIFFDNVPEYLTSILGDDIYHSALISARYFDGNGLTKDKCHLKSLDRWDYYIKPLIYGKYWKDELIYFPKFATIDNIDWMITDRDFVGGYMKEHAVVYPYYELLDFLKQNNSETKRVYENVPYTVNN